MENLDLSKMRHTTIDGHKVYFHPDDHVLVSLFISTLSPKDREAWWWRCKYGGKHEAESEVRNRDFDLVRHPAGYYVLTSRKDFR